MNAQPTTFSGTYTPRLDDKGRLTLPAQFRHLVEDGIVLTRGQENCVYGLTPQFYDSLVEKMRQLLTEEGLPDIPVQPLIVFTDEKVRLQASGSTVPFAKVKGLKDVLRRTVGKGKSVALTTARIREVQAIFDKRMQGAGAWR